MKDALLLSMPFVSPAWPAIGISTLQACLRREGFSCDVAYPNLLFAERIGIDTYSLVDDLGGDGLFAGDWVFARHLSGGRLDEAAYLDHLRRHLQDDAAAEAIADLRSAVGLFLEECLIRYRIAEYAIIGFSTTFEQTTASLCLARLIRARHPDKVIVFGGGNCDGVRGEALLRGFPWIDFVCRGEAEESFPALVRSLRRGTSPAPIPGVVHRLGDAVVANPSGAPIAPLDRLPIPSYDDYFAALSESPIAPDLQIYLIIEGSRGCWWGAKSHCTFCGLNRTSMAFRSKSADRLHDELRALRDRHGISAFLTADSIMDLTYFRTLLPRLAAEPLGVSLFYEVKSNLTREQTRLLAAAGVTWIQAGIESLSTRILDGMRKGVTALQNIQTVKWCREYGIKLSWNLLFGFPGERAEDYAQIEVFMDALLHLPPPDTLARVALDRFSPFHDDPARHGMRRVRPLPVYALIYDLPPEQIDHLAGCFDYDCDLEPYDHVRGVRARLAAWRSAADSASALTQVEAGNGDLVITDTRPGRHVDRVVLHGAERVVYELCDAARSTAQIRRHLDDRGLSAEMNGEGLKGLLDRMVGLRLMVRDGDQHLSLAIGARRAADALAPQRPEQRALPLVHAPRQDLDVARRGLGVTEDRRG